MDLLSKGQIKSKIFQRKIDSNIPDLIETPKITSFQNLKEKNFHCNERIRTFKKF